MRRHKAQNRPTGQLINRMMRLEAVCNPQESVSFFVKKEAKKLLFAVGCGK
jgi:hypothetical protein